jgi:hypothetical protein
MKRVRCLPLLLVGLVLLPAPVAGQPPKRDWEPVELIGTTSDFWFSRNWRSYYWREDFTFLLTEKDNQKKWRVVSREPTPAYNYRMGTTFTDLKVDWKQPQRVKVVGVKAVDRIPADFYNFKLTEANIATAMVVYVETAPDVWKEYYVNNWFHKWGDRADKVIHALYAGKPKPYDIYGFVNGQAAPFDKKSQAIIEQHKKNPSLMFHGQVHATTENAFGYQIELIDLIGRDTKSGGHVVLHGDAKTIPRLEGKKK